MSIHASVVSRAAAAALLCAAGCLGDSRAEPEYDGPIAETSSPLVERAAPSQRYSLVSRLFKDLDVKVVRVHNFGCFNGWTYTEDYQLSYPVCIAPLPGHCTDTYRVVHKCVDGAFQVISNTLVSHVCDYSYDGTSCDPIELPY